MSRITVCLLFLSGACSHTTQTASSVTPRNFDDYLYTALAEQTTHCNSKMTMAGGTSTNCSGVTALAPASATVPQADASAATR